MFKTDLTPLSLRLSHDCENSDGSTGSIIATPVPEPGTLGLVGLGMLAFAAVRRRG
jgi:PEP-CTERM motif